MIAMIVKVNRINHERSRRNIRDVVKQRVQRLRRDEVLDGAFRGVGDEEVVVRDGVVVTSSSLEMLTNSCLGGIMNNDSWGWKTMMHIRDKIKDHVLYEVGMGNKISIWYDKWNSFGTIGDVISQRDLYDARLPMDARVSDLISDNMWKWPSEWQAWFDMRESLPAIEWKSVIWFNQFIPKNGFILWLAIQKRLLTQDRMEK
ncbi:RNA-directed DNA polymerase, eukaryota, reverse transcriptase zinc-binding domain protein [Tanacetum coccineum]